MITAETKEKSKRVSSVTSINTRVVGYRKKTVRIESLWEIRRVSVSGFL
jgi:hypothetical protein